MNNSMIYALFILAIGFTTAVVYLLATDKIPTKLLQPENRVYYYLGALCIALYIISVIYR